jgi:hypothetical protein
MKSFVQDAMTMSAYSKGGNLGGTGTAESGLQEINHGINTA